MVLGVVEAILSAAKFSVVIGTGKPEARLTTLSTLSHSIDEVRSLVAAIIAETAAE